MEQLTRSSVFIIAEVIHISHHKLSPLVEWESGLCEIFLSVLRLSYLVSDDSPWGLANELVEYGFINDVSIWTWNVKLTR